MSLKPASQPDALRDGKYAHYLESFNKDIRAKISADQHQKLEAMAIQHRSSLSAIFRIAVQFFLDSFEAPEGGEGDA